MATTCTPLTASESQRVHYMQTRQPKKKLLTILFSDDDMALLRRVQDLLRPTFGDLSYAAVCRYGLRLAAAHLGCTPEPPIPLTCATEPLMSSNGHPTDWVHPASLLTTHKPKPKARRKRN